MSDFSLPADFPCGSSAFYIPGPVGQLESLSRCSSEHKPPTLAIICHPHPLYGGTMQNKVVHTLDKTFNKMGMETVRFNFRGVGNSAGEYAHGEGELEDLCAVVEWCRQRLPEHQLCLSGFSFGAYVAVKAAALVNPARLVTVAPPVNIFDFSGIEVPSLPWLLLQGDADEIVDAKQVQQWASQYSQVDIATLEGAGHFFHGRLNDLQKVISEHLLER